MTTTETRDLGTASYLLCLGYTVKTVEARQAQHRRAVYIILETDRTAAEVVADDTTYKLNKALVRPQQYRDAYKYLSDRVHDKLRGGGQ